VTELLRTAQEIIAATYQPLPLYLAVAVIYWILSTGLSVLQRVLERRLSLPGRH
jgi:cystine transport system permease protein